LRFVPPIVSGQLLLPELGPPCEVTVSLWPEI
jgi:hypothetical protein